MPRPRVGRGIRRFTGGAFRVPGRERGSPTGGFAPSSEGRYAQPHGKNTHITAAVTSQNAITKTVSRTRHGTR